MDIRINPSPPTLGSTLLPFGQSTSTVAGLTVGASSTWNGNKLGLAYGGTNADLSATGGTSQFLKQSSTGAAITVGRPAQADISGLTISDSPTFTGLTLSGLTPGSVPFIDSGGTISQTTATFLGTI